MDLTVVYYTANRISPGFELCVIQTLLQSIGDIPLISVSQKPMALGRNICVGDIGQTHLNAYRQILIGAKAAETEYIALTEDDILYPPDHFQYRPSRSDVAAYDMHKWALYTWVRPAVFQSSLPWHTSGCIAPRRLIIDALEERFDRYPDDSQVPLKFWGEIGRYEAQLGVTPRAVEEFRSANPHITIFHEAAMGFRHLGRRKKPGDIQVVEIAYWGNAERVLRSL